MCLPVLVRWRINIPSASVSRHNQKVKQRATGLWPLSMFCGHVNVKTYSHKNFLWTSQVSYCGTIMMFSYFDLIVFHV